MSVNLNGIDLSGGTPLATTRKAQGGSTGGSAAETPEQSSSPSEVRITSTAELLARVQQNLSAQPAVNATRVEAVRRALAEGSYRVNPDQVASGLMQSERDLSSLAAK